ncbi:MAG: fbpC [Chthoniobacteraceae bacterium]|nr:fbpC [Chthoniobacteraceae bacterium]
MANHPIWKLDHVSLEPDRLRDISLDISNGVTAVIGWSGAGKTSLLNILVGFEVPTRGRLIGGVENSAWVPQNGGLWSHSTAREHLEIANGFTDDVEPLLASFDLQHKADSRPDELSQGEQSRLSVARALATNSPVLVMDEPLVHVDPARAAKYWQLIRDHISQTGASLIFSTHVPETVLGEASQVICLKEGTVLHQGLVTDLYMQPATPELMNFLGAGNWLEPDDARLWLDAPVETARCIRPEQLLVSPAENGGFIVESIRSRGSVAEAALRHPVSGESRTFFHRPAAPLLFPGMHATLRIAP